ncbi:MAG: ABC transporter substrate-binding protein [Clostridia bacterium]|nr:ABC transporter substrate-binding protein [Clostridia bacterium]
MKHLRIFLFAALACLLLFSCISCSAADQSTAVSADPEASAESTQSAAAVSEEPSAEAAASSESGSAPSFPVEITDFLGYTSTVEAADRIVSLMPSGTQILLALGVEEEIVGLDAYSEPYLPGTEVVGDYMGPDVEKIVSLEPDLIVAANSIQQDAIDQLRAAGIPVLAAEPTTWEQVPEGFAMIGEAVQRTDAADELASQLQDAVEAVQKDAPAEAVSCYYVLSYGDAGNWTSGEGSFINAMMEHAGGTPITQGTASPWLEYPMEDLTVADPDCIILGSGAGTIEDFVQTAGYRDLSAVKSGHVYEIDSDLVTIPGPELQEGLKEISYIINTAAVSEEQEAA